MKKPLLTLFAALLLTTLYAQSYRLVLPKDNFVGNGDSATTFRWSVVDAATSYQLQVATDAAFVAVVFDTTTSATGLKKSLAFGQSYYWRIRAYQSATPQLWSYARQFSVFKPSQVTGLVLWLDAAQNVTSAANKVSAWGDLSAGITATQNNATNKPNLVANGLCGKPTINFTGQGGFNTSSNMAFPTVSVSDFTCLQVRNYVTSTNVIQYVLGGTAQGIIANSNFYGSGFGTYHSSGNCLYASLTSANPAGFGIYSVQRNHVFRNFVELGFTPPNNNFPCLSVSPIAVTTLGARPDNLTLPASYKGDIAEILLYNSSLDDSIRLLAEKYLHDKYTPPVDLGPDTIMASFCVSATLSTNGCFASYLWSTGETTATINATTFGTYWVRATDAFGIQTSDTINVRPQIQLKQLPASVFLCARDTVEWNTGYPALGYTFLWSNNATSPSIFITQPGTYSVRIKDASPCFYNSAVTTVTVDPFPNFTLGPDTSFCSGNRLNFTYPDSLSYILWSTGDATNETVIIDSGNYSVVAVNENGCIVADTIHVAIKGYAPNVEFTNPVLCATDSILFTDATVPPAGNAIVSWTWDFGGGDTSNLQNVYHTFPAFGTFNVALTARTDSGCVNSASKNLSVYLKPVADFQSKVSCAQAETQFLDLSSTSLPATLSRWNWQFINGDTSFARNSRYVFTQPGKYGVMLTVTNTPGCTDVKTDSIEVFAPFQADFGFKNICFGDSTAFRDITSSLSIVSWLWNTGDNFITTQKTFNHLYTDSGTYVVNLQVQNAIGCIDTVNKLVTVYPPPVAKFGHLYNCEDQLYAPLDSSIIHEDQNTWNWAINGTLYKNTRTPQYFFADTGSYPINLTVTSASGCTDTASGTIFIKPTPDAAFSFTPLYGDAPLDVRFTNKSKNADTYLWSFGDGATDDAVNPSHTYTSNDTFDIKLVANSIYGCTDSAEGKIGVIVTDLDVSVDDVLTTSQPLSDGTVLVSVTGYITNVGRRLVTHMQVYATIGSGGVMSEEIDTLLPPGGFLPYTFKANFVVGAENANTYVCVEVKVANHGETETTLANNKQCASLNDILQLIGPSPNPASSSATLGLILPKSGKVTIDMINVLGQVVMEAEELSLPAGRSDYMLPVKILRKGEYFIRIKYNDDKLLRKLVIH